MFRVLCSYHQLFRYISLGNTPPNDVIVEKENPGRVLEIFSFI